MGLHIHYFRAPTDYTDKLKRDGKRAKARAFWEYCDDVNSEMHNSERFYVESWGVGKGTVGRWLREFKYQYELFIAAWELTNSQVKKEAGHLRGSRDVNLSYESTVNTDFKKNSVAEVGHSRGEVFNSNINNYCPKSKIPSFSDEDMALSELLYSKLSTIHPSMKKPNLSKWADSVRLMRERDNREIKAIENMIMMIFDDNPWFDGTFWRSNIKSTDKLRAQFDTIYLQIKSRKRAA